MSKNVALIIIIIICCFAIGCSEQSSNSGEGNTDSLYVMDSVSNISYDTSSKSKPGDTLSTHELSPGSDTLVAEKYIAGIKEHSEIAFSVSSGKMIHAILEGKSDSSNIRIGQIQMPDGSLDGPFGKQLNYKVAAPGKYKFIVSENMMAEGEWAGDFTIKIWVTD